MNLYETLQEALRDIDITGGKDDDGRVLNALKMVLVTKTTNEAYEVWVKNYRAV